MKRSQAVGKWVTFLVAATLGCVRVTDAAETVTYDYDALGRLVTVTEGTGTSTQYALDALGNRTALTTITGGSIRFSGASYAAGETSGQQVVTVTVQRIGTATGAASVNYATANQTATSGTDYNAASGLFTWNAGDSSDRTFQVTVLDDFSIEGTETLNVVLSNVSGAVLGSPSSAAISIADDDSPGVVQFTQVTHSIAENGSSISLSVQRPSGNTAISATYQTVDGSAVSGSDYIYTTGTLSWGAGDATNKTIVVPIVNDAVIEGTESFTVALTPASGGVTIGGNNPATITVTNEDFPPPGTVQFTASDFPAYEGAANITFSVSRAGGSYGAASVNWAVSEGTALSSGAPDYCCVGGPTGVFTWNDGETTTKTFNVFVYNDFGYEPNEYFYITLSNASGATLGGPAVATGTILNDDSAPDTEPPSVPGNITFTNQTTSSITASWGQATDNIAVTKYRYAYAAGGPWTEVGNVLTYPLTGLAQGNYTLYVQAGDAASNWGPAASAGFVIGTPTYTDVLTVNPGSMGPSFGYAQGTMGSMSPTTTTTGKTYRSLYDYYDYWSGIDGVVVDVCGFSANPGIGWLVTIVGPNGITKYGINAGTYPASYTYSGGCATWNLMGVGGIDGNPDVFTVVHQ